jgi:hypothetical protein
MRTVKIKRPEKKRYIMGISNKLNLKSYRNFNSTRICVASPKIDIIRWKEIDSGDLRFIKSKINEISKRRHEVISSKMMKSSSRKLISFLGGLSLLVLRRSLKMEGFRGSRLKWKILEI